MADINKTDIKLMESQRLDDTDQGGGQMTAIEIVSGTINNLFPDISRFDRVYGRVSVRKCYAAVQTGARETYYGSHTILTEQAKDKNVSVCFFSSEDWFDIRSDARDRMEAYLVQGTRLQLNLWGTHYKGTSVLSLFTEEGWVEPEVGDVIILFNLSQSIKQYVRVIDIESESRTFYDSTTQSDYSKKIITLSLGTQLDDDTAGQEVTRSTSYVSEVSSLTQIYSTVAADASRYYGVSILQEDAGTNDLNIRVDSIKTSLVPSAASETSVTDAGVGVSVSPIIQTRADPEKITRSITFLITDNSRLYIGEGIVPGTFSFVGGIPGDLEDDGNGNIKNATDNVGSIAYETGIISFGSIGGLSYSGTGNATYTPAAPVTQISETGSIKIETNNRGFVYNFTCNPIPKAKTLKVEYLAGGKWYSMWDQGSGKISGLEGFDVGSGVLNFNTGTVSVTLSAQPDVGSRLLFFWGKDSEFYDIPEEDLKLRYKFFLQHDAIVRTTFEYSWVGDSAGPGPDGRYCVMDDGNGGLTLAEWSGTEWIAPASPIYAGDIQYSTGLVDIFIPTAADASPTSISSPDASENFLIEYNYGEKFEDVFQMPPRDVNGNLNIALTNTPILPNTFEIEWNTDLVEYDPETRIDITRDPHHEYKDDGSGNFEGEVDSELTGWVPGNVNYVTGDVILSPDRKGYFPFPKYDWVDTAWLHPGVEQTRVFTDIQYLPAASIWPTEGTVTCRYSTTDGANSASYFEAKYPTFFIDESSSMQILPDSLKLFDGTVRMFDGGDGKIYTSSDGVDGTRLVVGTVNYIGKSFEITVDSINIESIQIVFGTLTAAIEPTMSMVFRSPGAPIRPGSFTIRATTGEGTLLEGASDFSGDIIGNGMVGHVDFSTGLCYIVFGLWIVITPEVEAQDWFLGAPQDGSGNVWKPYLVHASTILVNAVITSYLPLDADLLGLDPVRLPLDGKVQIFRDGYVINIHHTETYNIIDIPVQRNFEYYVGRTDLDLIEVYDTQDDPVDGNPYSSDFPEFVPEIGEGGEINYTVNLSTGKVIFTEEFNALPYKQPFKILNRWEDMALASDVQVTGHISITTPLRHDYPGLESNALNPTLVSSVLPSGDLQSRAYNEFEQSAWSGEWSDYVIGAQPLSSYNFVDYPITVTNKPSIKERWLILFRSTTTVDVIGENFGVLTSTAVSINEGGTYLAWDNTSSGTFLMSDRDINDNIITVPFLIIANKQFPGEYYWKIRLSGFGAGWQSGNCIRFNQDAANFPLWFVRTTLQAPATEQIDHYTIQVRGDSS